MKIKLTSTSYAALCTTLFAGLLFSPRTIAQETPTESSTIGIGLHGGLNFSDYSYSNSFYNQYKTNRTGGLVGFHLEGMNLLLFSMRIEANYSQKGYNLGPYVNVVHSYLQVPVLFKFTPVAGPLSIFLEAGPAASLHLKKDVEVLDQTTSYDDASDSWDFSAIAGVGVAINLQVFTVEVEARYDYGLKNLSNSNSVEIKSRSIQVLAGLTFPI